MSATPPTSTPPPNDAPVADAPSSSTPPQAATTEDAAPPPASDPPSPEKSEAPADTPSTAPADTPSTAPPKISVTNEAPPPAATTSAAAAPPKQPPPAAAPQTGGGAPPGPTAAAADGGKKEVPPPANPAEGAVEKKPEEFPDPTDRDLDYLWYFGREEPKPSVASEQWESFVKTVWSGPQSVIIHTVFLPPDMPPDCALLDTAEIVSEKRYTYAPGVIPDIALRPAAIFEVQADSEVIPRTQRVPELFTVMG